MSNDSGVAQVRVFVSSPGDLRAERLLVAKICGFLTRSMRIPIRALLWEGGGSAFPEVEAFPPYMTGQGAQKAIDQRLWDELGGCDIYVGMIWRRMGTPTGRWRSGTEAEYRGALVSRERTGRPAIILFYEKVAESGDADPEQLALIEQFKSELQSDGLLQPFKDEDDLENHLVAHLADAVNDLRNADLTNGVVIALGEPVEYPDEYADLHHLVPNPQYASSGTTRPPEITAPNERILYRLFRILVSSEGGDAKDVFVQIAAATPPLPTGVPTPILHLAGDNPSDYVSYSESGAFRLTEGVSREVDVVAVTKNAPFRCFISSIASMDAWEEHDELAGQYVLTLAAPGGITREYRIDVDLNSGTLSMETVEAKESNAEEDFWLEPGAPTFKVSPGVDSATAETVKLLMTFGQTSGDDVTPVIEWLGSNINPSQPLMMPENQRPGARFMKYQLKPALAQPVLPNDGVTFDIRFRWQGALRQYRWFWPLYMRERGIWGMDNNAENTLEPAERTTLD